MNTLLPKIARITHELDWSDGLLPRVNKVALNDLYNNYNDKTANNKALKLLLDRKSLKVLSSPEILNTLKYKLYDHAQRLKLIRNYEDWKRAIAGTTLFKNASEFEMREIFKDPIKAIGALEKVNRDAEWMLSNDMTDMVSTKLVGALIDKLPEKIKM